MRNNPLVRVLWVLCPLLFLTTIGWSANETTHKIAKEDFNCSISLTATPNGLYCGETIGSIDVKISGGKAPYTIEWDNNDSSIWAEISTNESSYTIPDLPFGMYTVKVRDADGCRDMVTNVMMDVNASDLTYTIEPSDPCVANGSMIIRVAGSSAPYWVILEGPTSGGVIANSNSFRIDNLLGGDYKIIVDKDGCGHEQNVTLVTTPIALSASAVSNDSNECDALGGVQLNISGGTSEYLISWAGPVVGTTRSTGSKLIQNLQPGDYTFTVRDANYCTTTTTATVTATGTDLACVLTQTPVLCDNMGQIGVAINGGKAGYSVSYSGPISGSVSATSNSSKSGTASILDLPPGTYAIVVTDSRGCTAGESITVGGTITDLKCIVTQTPVLCDNMGQIGVAINGGEPTYRIDYSGPRSGSVIATTTAAKVGNGTILDLPAGYYTIIVTDSRGCSASESITVGGSITDLACIVTQTPVLCDNMGQIGVAINGGEPTYRIDYSGPRSGSVIATTTAAKAGNGTILDLPAGTYTIVVTDSRGCSATESITVGGTITDLKCIVTQTPVLCDNMGQIGVAINGGEPTYRIDYSGPRTGYVIATTTAAKAGNGTILDLPAGYYTIVVTDSRGCSATENITVGGSITDLACVVSQTPQVCNTMGSIGVLITGGAPSYRVDYSGPSSGFVVASNTGDRSATAVVTGLSAGYYKITVTDSRGCSASENISVTGGSSNLSCDVLGQPQICEQNSGLEVTVNGGKPNYTISYSGPVSGSIASTGGKQFIPLPIGTYTVTVTDAQGCSTTEVGTVGQGTNDLHCRLVKTHAICDKPGAIEVIISGGKPGFTVKWSAGHAEQTAFSPGYNYKFEVPCPGTYDIIVIDANGCEVMESTTIFQLDNNLTFSLLANAGIQEGNGWIEVYFQEGRAPYTIDLTGPVNQIDISNGAKILSSLPSGYYSVNITDANGCQKQEYITVPTVGGSTPNPGPVTDGMRVTLGDDNPLEENVELEGQVSEDNTEFIGIIPFANGVRTNEFMVFQNYPNPFQTSTKIGFNLPAPMKATIMIHDHLGKTVNMVEGDFAKGYNEYELNSNDLGNGVYYYTITAGKYSKTTRMLHMER